MIQPYPVSFIEINPEDATRLEVISGDLVAVESDRVRTADGDLAKGAISAVAYVSDSVQPGTIFAMFHYPGSPVNAVVTADAASSPINPRQPFKVGRTRLTRIGCTDLADVMPFAPRNVV